MARTAVAPAWLHLFWSAPLEESKEFTPEDPLALDYLAQQVGNWLLPGFTTRTSRANYYMVVLYGLGIAERALTERRQVPTDEALLEAFERFERFWAMAVLHSFGGSPPGDETMRGIRGAKRAYPGDVDAFPLDYDLISRQTELGGLGAYLTSLRHFRLVEEGGLRLTGPGRELAGHFFFSPGENKFESQYQGYVGAAMEPDAREVPAKLGAVRLLTVGEAMRLGRIRERKGVQDQLHNILFESAPTLRTREMGRVLVDAATAGVHDAPSLLGKVATGGFGASEDLQQTAILACRFSELATSLRRVFDAGYQLVASRSFSAPLVEAAGSVEEEAAAVQEGARRFLATAHSSKVATLPVHGAAFIQLCRQVESAAPQDMLRALLVFHDRVQKERKRGRGWLRVAGDSVAAELATYSTATLEPNQWRYDFKVGAVRSILEDLGRLA